MTNAVKSNVFAATCLSVQLSNTFGPSYEFVSVCAFWCACVHAYIRVQCGMVSWCTGGQVFCICICSWICICIFICICLHIFIWTGPWPTGAVWLGSPVHSWPACHALYAREPSSSGTNSSSFSSSYSYNILLLISSFSSCLSSHPSSFSFLPEFAALISLKFSPSAATSLPICRHCPPVMSLHLHLHSCNLHLGQMNLEQVNWEQVHLGIGRCTLRRFTSISALAPTLSRL